MTDGYQCKYCKKPFQKESAFMRHECTAMLRSKEIATIEGRQAYELYKVWLEKQKRKAPPIETFMTSTYYTSFYKFACWVRDTGIPSPEKYVELMSEKKISPALWRRNETYAIYLDWNDQRSTPVEQAEVAMETIQSLSAKMNCSASQVFSNLRSGQVLELIQQRRLSPWLLFCSRAFKDWVGKLDPVERQMLMESIGVDFWAHKLERAPDTVKGLRELAEALGI